MIIQVNGYTYDVCWNGTHYLAICQRTGHAKKRFDRRVWYNANGARVTDENLLTVLETAVSDLQSQRSKAQHPARGKHPHLNINSERPVRKPQRREWTGPDKS